MEMIEWFYLLGTIAFAVWIVFILILIVAVLVLARKLSQFQRNLEQRVDEYGSYSRKVLPLLGRSGAMLSVASVVWSMINKFRNRR